MPVRANVITVWFNGVLGFNLNSKNQIRQRTVVTFGIYFYTFVA
jgi:hypothetical protein